MERITEERIGSALAPFQLGIAIGAEPHRKKLNVVCIGAHPDDPETGCGGTLAKLAAEGHRVHIIYLTRGEAGVRGEDWARVAQLRSNEALAACDILSGSGHFAGQVDSQTTTDPEACGRFTELLLSLEPDIVFTHWSFDTHADHRTAAQLTYQAWQWANESFALVYYEVMTGVQTHDFHPNCFVDISETYHRKREAVYAHTCQNPDRFYPYHEAMEKQRGAESNCERAEAFIVMREKSPKPLMPFAI